MCKSDRKVRQFNSAQTAEFIIFSLTWRAAHKAGWFNDWNRKETASSRSDRAEGGVGSGATQKRVREFR